MAPKVAEHLMIDWKEWSEKHPPTQKNRSSVNAGSSTSPEFKEDAANGDRFNSPRAFLTSR